jgi:hypothetical protein
MTDQPTLSAHAELSMILQRYDHGGMPEGVAARVAELRRLIARIASTSAFDRSVK